MSACGGKSISIYNTPVRMVQRCRCTTVKRINYIDDDWKKFQIIASTIGEIEGEISGLTV